MKSTKPITCRPPWRRATSWPSRPTSAPRRSRCARAARARANSCAPWACSRRSAPICRKRPTRWIPNASGARLNTATVGFGHGISPVSLLSFTAALATVVNGGRRIDPTFKRQAPGADRRGTQVIRYETSTCRCAKCCAMSPPTARAATPTRPAMPSAARPAPPKCPGPQWPLYPECPAYLVRRRLSHAHSAALCGYGADGPAQGPPRTRSAFATAGYTAAPRPAASSSASPRFWRAECAAAHQAGRWRANPMTPQSPSTITGVKDFKGLTSDSRKVKPGYLFAALSGTRTDGARFVKDAVARGATAVLGAARTGNRSRGAGRDLHPGRKSPRRSGALCRRLLRHPAEHRRRRHRHQGQILHRRLPARNLDRAGASRLPAWAPSRA